MQKLANDQLLGPDVARVKIWAEDGTIVFSDDARLIGTRYPLGEEELEVLREGGIEAEVSDLSRPENRFEVGGGDLLEVYTPVTSPKASRCCSRPTTAMRRSTRQLRSCPTSLFRSLSGSAPACSAAASACVAAVDADPA